jgi:hypothetical protein
VLARAEPKSKGLRPHPLQVNPNDELTSDDEAVGHDKAIVPEHLEDANYPASEQELVSRAKTMTPRRETFSLLGTSPS